MSWMHLKPECIRKLEAPVALILKIVTMLNIIKLCIAQVLLSDCSILHGCSRTEHLFFCWHSTIWQP